MAPRARRIAPAPAWAALLSLPLAAPAAAAPEAAAIWRDLQDALAAYGYEAEVDGEEVADDRVRLRGLSLVSETEGQALDERNELVGSTERVVVRVGDVELREEGDAVAILLPAEVPVALETTVEGEPPVIVTGRVLSEGLAVAVSEAEGGYRYTVDADAQSLVLDDVEGGGAPVDLDVTIRVEDLSSESLSAAAEGGRTGTQSQRAARLTAEVRFEDPAPDGGGAFDLAYAMADLSLTAESRTPEGTDLSDLAALVRAGGLYDVELLYGASRLEAAVDGPGGAFAATGAGEAGALSLGMDEAGFAYALRTTGTALTLRGDALPVPELSYTVGGTATELRLPLLAGPAPQPFAFAVALRDLALDDALWSLFDPGAVLPRDPATLDLSLDGTALVPEDLLGAMEPDDESDANPPSLVALAIERLVLDVAGARLTASGAFEAAEEGTPAAPGLPPLSGALQMDLSGAEALLDSLVAIGLMPQEQAAFVRGMLGFVARPTGTDAYATEIELGADGSVTAGGMALR